MAMDLKKTKLICTIGPASEDKELIKELMIAGMNGARLNFSHGTHDEHKVKMDRIKEARKELKLPVAIVLDTKGPEIRTGKFEGGQVNLEENQTFTIKTSELLGDCTQCSTTYNGITNDVKKGDRVLIDDGLIEMTVDDVKPDALCCIVNNGGIVKDHKSINLPGVKVALPALSETDKKDILFGIEQGVDFIAASFVRKAADVRQIKDFLKENNGEMIKVISKIENKEGVDNIDEIIEASDGIMVARGDLGVEIPPEEVPIIQKRIIKACNQAGKLVITATQMMDSMIRNPRPTRAEVADVANAIFDGTDVIMLSGETASGKYPIIAAQTMVNVAKAAEDAFDYQKHIDEHNLAMGSTVTNAIGYSTCSSAESLNAKAILTPTSSGYTASVISMYRPQAPIIAFSTQEEVVRSLSLVWGVNPHYLKNMKEENAFFRAVVNCCKSEGYIKDNDIVILTAGIPLGIGGKTNMMRIHRVGDKF